MVYEAELYRTYREDRDALYRGRAGVCTELSRNRRMNMKKFLALAALLLASLAGNAQCSFTTTSLTGGTTGVPYTGAIGVGGCPSSTTQVRTLGYWPLGIVIASNGMISGTPALAGKYYFQMKLSWKANGITNSKTQDFWMEVVDPLVITAAPQTVPWMCGVDTTAALFDATGGWPPYTWSATGLPPGVTIDPGSGTLKGIVACCKPSDNCGKVVTYNIVVTAQDSGDLPMVASLHLTM